MTAYEISPQAAAVARERNPEMRVEQRFLRVAEERFDMAMLVDVLEHVENPWELLRTVRTNCRYLVVRQPLLGNFSRFRYDDYRNQREHWGHISCFNYRSFLDMASACGWLPLKLELRAPWELIGHDPLDAGFLKRLVARKWPVAASFFIDGFYLIAAFKAAEIQ